MNVFDRFPVLSRLIVAILIIALIGLLAWGAWTLAYDQGWVSRAPTLDLVSLFTEDGEGGLALEPAPTTEPAQAKVQPTAAPEQPTVAPTEAPPKVVPTAAPTASPTEAPKKPDAAVYTFTGEKVSFTMKDADTKEQKVDLETFTYKGGWQRGTDSWFVAKDNNLTKETPESFGMPISGDEWATKITNWLKSAMGNPWSLTWLRFQTHMESFGSMEKTNQYAANLADLPSEEYDEIANATLKNFFKKISGGRGEVNPNWGLEVMLREPGKDKGTLELFARTNSDGNHTPDLLVTFYAKGESTSFVSYKGAWKIAAKAAGVNANSYKPRAYINLTEGGTWKWKPASGGNGGTPPTDAPTSTPKPDGGRPTKNPSQRPTPPVGGGGTNPENSEDPHTKEHTESTPAPKVTNTPKPTSAPTPVPTAVVRPTEACETGTTPVREDTKPAPSSDSNHNVPTSKPEGEADDSFDPNSI